MPWSMGLSESKLEIDSTVQYVIPHFNKLLWLLWYLVYGTLGPCVDTELVKTNLSTQGNSVG